MEDMVQQVPKKESWVTINEQIFQMEKEEKVVRYDTILYEEWKKKWNELISKGDKIAGVVKREKK